MKFIYPLLLLVWLFCSPPAQAETLAERVAAFPDWQSKPTAQAAEGDLAYPDWLAGTWHVKSTLVDLVAPFAPDIITPGFESNREYLNQPVAFDVRFVQQSIASNNPILRALKLPSKSSQTEIVADRAFNGLNLAKAYLGDRAVLAVKVDPSSPNRQITLLHGDRQLISIINSRAVETPAPDQFITTEIFQQVFRGMSQPYLNQVETTTAYQRGDTIEADQITAVYLSPQDPNYFKAGETPVALYRYRLDFLPIDEGKYENTLKR